MSTILEALRERDRQAAPGAGEALPWRDAGAWTRWRRPAAAVTGLAGIVAATLVIRSTLPRLSPRQAAAPVAAPTVTVELPVPPAPAPPMRHGDDEPPRARVGRWRPSASSPLAPAPSDTAAATALPAAGTATAIPPTQPSLRLETIRYTEAPGERTVALAIDGAPTVSLRQGESASGVEVQLILPEGVYVRRGPDVFALGTVR